MLILEQFYHNLNVPASLQQMFVVVLSLHSWHQIFLPFLINYRSELAAVTEADSVWFNTLKAYYISTSQGDNNCFIIKACLSFWQCLMSFLKSVQHNNTDRKAKGYSDSKKCHVLVLYKTDHVSIYRFHYQLHFNFKTLICLLFLISESCVDLHL